MFVLVSVAVALTFFFLSLSLPPFQGTASKSVLTFKYMVPTDHFRLVWPLTCILSQFMQFASYVSLNLLCVNVFKTTWRGTLRSKATVLSESLTLSRLLPFTFFTWLVFRFCRLRVPADSLIPLTKTDESKLSSLLRRPYLTQQPNWKNEVSDGEGKKPLGGAKCENVGMRYELSWNNILGQFHFHGLLFLVVIKHDVNLLHLTRNKCVM